MGDDAEVKDACENPFHEKSFKTNSYVNVDHAVTEILDSQESLKNCMNNLRSEKQGIKSKHIQEIMNNSSASI